MIEAIKSALPFEAVLRDAGIRIEHGKAPCPFHEDKTPSFSVKGEVFCKAADGPKYALFKEDMGYAG